MSNQHETRFNRVNQWLYRYRMFVFITLTIICFPAAALTNFAIMTNLAASNKQITVNVQKKQENTCFTSPGNVLDFMYFKNMNVGSYIPLGVTDDYCGYAIPINEAHPNGTVQVAKWEHAIIVVQSVIRWPANYGTAVETFTNVDTVAVKEYRDTTPASRLWWVSPSTVYIFIPALNISTTQYAKLNQCAVLNPNNNWWIYNEIFVSNEGTCHFKKSTAIETAQQLAS